MNVVIQLASISGGWLRRTARLMGEQLLRRAGAHASDDVGGVSSTGKSIDGFLLRAIRVGRRAVVKIIDPPGTVGFATDPHNAGFGSTQASIRYRLGPARDWYSPSIALEYDGESVSPKSLEPTIRTWVSKDRVLEDMPVEDIPLTLAWSSPFSEYAGALHRFEIVSEGGGTPDTGYGLTDERHLLMMLTRLTGFPGLSERVFISERYIAQQTGGFRLAQRVYAGNGEEDLASVTLPQLPMGECCWYDKHIIVALSVSKSSQPDDPLAWRDDAGVGGVLVVRIGFDEDHSPYWDWHHLLRFDSTDEPMLSAEAWRQSWVDFAAVNQHDNPLYQYPLSVSGLTQNSVRRLYAAFDEDSCTVFFSAMFGRQDDGPAMYQQIAVASLSVTGTAETSPSVALKVIEHDVIARADSAVYALYGSGDPLLARRWTVNGAVQLEEGARALVHSMVLSRENPFAKTQWFGPWINEFGTYRAAEPLSEIQILSPDAVHLQADADQLGATRLYRWSAGDSFSPINYAARLAKAVTKVGANKFLFSGYSLASGWPAITQFVEYGDGAFTLKQALTPWSGSVGTVQLERSLPALSCYQHEYTRPASEGEDEVVPYCVLASYSHIVSLNQEYGATFLSRDGAQLFELHARDIGASHGAYYTGPLAWALPYGSMFGE